MKRVLSATLALVMALSCFCYIPLGMSIISAEEIGNSGTQTYNNVQNLSEEEITLSYTDKQTFQNPVAAGPDPYVFKDTDGTYYMYGTTAPNTGYYGYTSKDLVNWSSIGYVLKKSDVTVSGVENSGNFWAPEVVEYNGTYYMIITSNEHLVIATAASPKGPFKTAENASYLFEGKTIDGHLFFDDDGKVYLYYVKVDYDTDLQSNANVIWGCEFNMETLTPVEGTETKLIYPDRAISWENGSNNNVAEGPAMLKKDGKYYLIYTCNGYTNKAYAVGVAQGTTALGSFHRQSNNPVLVGSDAAGIVGTGHCCYTTSPDGSEYWMVYHKHAGLNTIHTREVCLDKITFDAQGNIVVAAGFTAGSPTTEKQPYPSGAVSTLKDAKLDSNFKAIATLPTVYVHANDGSDTGAGTEASPYKTLEKAYEALTPNGGTIVLLSSHTLASDTSPEAQAQTTPGFYKTPDTITGPILLRGINPGIRFAFSHLSLGSDHYIDNLMLMATASASTIECGFNNVTFGENLSVLPYYTAEAENQGRYPLIIGGYNQYGFGNREGDEYLKENPYVNMLQDVRPYEVVSTNEDYNITVLGGTWRSVMGGNYRPKSDASVGLIDADVTVTLGGNCVVIPVYSNKYETDLAISATGYSALSANGTATLNITGGEYNVPIYVSGKIGSVENVEGVTHATERHHGDYFFNVTGGKINGSTIAGTVRESVASATQDPTFGVEGDFTLRITDPNAFTSAKPFFYMTNGAMTVAGESTAYLIGKTFNYVDRPSFDTVYLIGSQNVAEDRTVFVKQGATGDGLSVDSPMNSITEAYKLLGYEGGTIVIMDDFKLGAHFYEPIHHSGKITITSRYNGTDYNGVIHTNGASRRYALNGDTTFEYIKLSTGSSTNQGLFVIADYFHIEIGEGVVCEGFASNQIANAVTLLGGMQGDYAPIKDTGSDAHITVRSGSGILIAGLNRQSTVAHNRNVTIDIYGGEIGSIYGGTVNQAITTGGDVTANIYGGKFVNAIDLGYYVAGSVTLNVEGGDFSSCPSVTGKAGYAIANLTDEMKESIKDKLSEFEIAGEEDYDVVYLKDGGTGDGKSAATAVGTFDEAFEKLGANGGTIVVCGPIALTTNITEQAHSGQIVVTQKYGNEDYTAGGGISTDSDGNIYALNGPTKFENISFSCSKAGAPMFIVAHYNTVEIGEGVVCSGFNSSSASKGFTIIGGRNNGGKPISEGTGDAHIIIRSGSGIAIAGLNRFDATNTRTARIEIYGGEIGKIFGGNINKGTGGSSDIVIHGGTFIDAIDCGYGLTGTATLTIKGGDFSRCTSIKGKSGASSAIVYTNIKDEVTPLLTAFDTVSYMNKVVYLKNGGTGDGSTPETALGTLDAAYAALGNGGGHIVICGTYTMTGAFVAPAHTGTVTITQKDATGDYTLAGSFFTGGTGRRYEVGGPTIFSNIKITTDNSASLLFVAHYHSFELGEGVVTSGFKGTQVADSLTIVGGNNADVVSAYQGTGDAHITVRSGSGILIAGLNRYTYGDHERNATIDIYGGTFGAIYGGNINGNVGGSTEINIYGGTFTKPIDCGYGIGGSVALYIEDGDFSACSSITGLAGNATARIYNKYEYSLVPKMTEFDNITLLSRTVYVMSGGTGDGSSPESPLGTITPAYALLGDNGGTIVFVGQFNMGGTFTEPAHTGKIVLTQNYNDVDYRANGTFSTNGAGRKWTLGGPLVIENMNIVTQSTSHYLFFVAKYNRFELGEGVTCTGFGGTTVDKSFSIVGGVDSAASAGSGTAHIVIKSGSGILIAGLNRMTKVDHKNNVKIDIYGGNISTLYGGNINNNSGGDVEINIYGGTFKTVDCAMGSSGTVTLNVSGGNFDACTAIKGNANLTCIATVSEKMEDTVVPLLTGFGTITTSSGSTTVLVPEEVFGSGSFTATDGTTIPYRVYYPEGYETSGKTYPIFVYFHGNGSRGTDNKLQLGANHALVTKVLNCGTECVIIAPQCPKDSAWVKTYPGDANFDPTVAPESVHLTAAIELINEMLTDTRIDNSRLYLGGASNGGAACWSIISRNPNAVAGAIIQAGTGSSAAPGVVAQSCLNTPIWTFHGDVDTTLSVEGTRAIVNAIKDLGGKLITYTEMPGYDHNIWVDSANKAGLYDWLFAQSRDDYRGKLYNTLRTSEDFVIGDVDDDGSITNSDITYIIRYLSGFSVSVDRYVADITADSKINNRDAIAIIQTVAGWYEE